MKTGNVLKTMTLVALTSSMTAFAGTKDLKLFNTLAKVGVKFESEMSKTYVGVDSVECKYNYASNRSSCSMTDTSIEANGAVLKLQGKKAKRIFNQLEAWGVPTDGALGTAYKSANSIVCSQVAEGVADGTAAERTNCTVNFETF